MSHRNNITGNVVDVRVVPEYGFHRKRATHTLHTLTCHCKMNIETQNYVGWKVSLEFI